jgi:hypothetical protein
MKITPAQSSLKKEQKNFRLSYHCRVLIEKMALSYGITESALMEVLIREAADRRGLSAVK